MTDLNLTHKKWAPGEWIFINKLQWGNPEIERVIEVLAKDWFGHGEFNITFENGIKRFGDLRYFYSVNSGSAAIEMAVQTLVQLGLWKRGDKFLHPSLTFPTSLSTALMAGLVPVFVDVDPGTYVINAERAAQALQADPNIKGAIIPLLLGNVPDLDVLKSALGDRPLIIDSCDTMGSKWRGREAITFGDIGAYSFYGSHHISTFGVGGGVGTNNEKFAETLNSMRLWGRKFNERQTQLESFLNRYTYETLGLDSQMTAVQAAFGVAQLERLPEYIGKRHAIFVKLQRLFSRYMRYFILPERASDKADVSWFCYPIIVRPEAPFTRNEFAQYILDNKIEIRPIFTNILEHPMFKGIPYLIHGTTENTEMAIDRGFFIPACPMEPEQEEYYFNVLTAFLERY